MKKNKSIEIVTQFRLELRAKIKEVLASDDSDSVKLRAVEVLENCHDSTRHHLRLLLQGHLTPEMLEQTYVDIKKRFGF